MRWSVNTNLKKQSIKYKFMQWVVFCISNYACPLGQPCFFQPSEKGLCPLLLCPQLGSVASPTRKGVLHSRTSGPSPSSLDLLPTFPRSHLWHLWGHPAGWQETTALKSLPGPGRLFHPRAFSLWSNLQALEQILSSWQQDVGCPLPDSHGTPSGRHRGTLYLHQNTS